MKTYFHVDMDAFFVSVEELFDPSLKGKPVVVGGQRDERGVVSAASYAARKFGVHSAMPLRTAAKLCPQAIFVDGHPSRYRDKSQEVRAVLDRFSPLVEMASIDEAYLDMTGTDRLLGPPLKAAHALHEAMKRETKLNCSIGIASSRVVAKITSDQAKPNGVLWVVPGCEAAFIGKLEVRKMPGVGKVTEKRLQELGILTIADLAARGESVLREDLGEWGAALAAKARGEDAGGWYDAEIGEDIGPKSVSHEHTFSVDVAEPEKLEGTLLRLSEMVGRRLRESDLRGRTITLKLRYTDFSTITRAHSLEQPTYLDQEIYGEIGKLFRANWKEGRSVRLLGVTVSGFSESQESVQLDLLGAAGPAQTRGKWDKALTAADRLRDKYGDSSVVMGTSVGNLLRERVHEALPERPDKKKG